jgi:YVTN family beta-propeller protein
MSFYRAFVCVLLFGAIVACNAAPLNPTLIPITRHHQVIQRIKGPDGAYDYLSVDSSARKLFVGREYGVMTVDLATGEVTNRLVPADNVAAVLILPGTSEMLSTVYFGNKALIFDRSTGAIRAEIATGTRPDAAAYDPYSGLVFVMNAGSKDVTIIDPKLALVVATIPVGGKPEAAASDGTGRVFINIEDSAEIVVIDVKRRQLSARYEMSGCEEPTGITFDSATNTLISACHNQAVKLIDATTGADRGTVAVGKNADGAIFDPSTRLVYVPCNDGTLTVFRLDADAKPQDIETVTTQPGARTAALDPITGRIYLAAGQFTQDDQHKKRFVPGSFDILVVAPK